MSYIITRTLEFDAGHRVPLHESKCKFPHGHRYKVEVTCMASTLTAEGFVIDFGIVKKLVGGWIDEYLDHRFIAQSGDAIGTDMQSRMPNSVFWMMHAPTAENIARLLYKQSDELLCDHNINVLEVTVWETPNCKATWTSASLPSP